MEENVVKENGKVVSEKPSISTQDLLTSIYDITRAIFRHLPIRSVDSCSLVCQSWAHMSRLTKMKRQSLHAITYPSDPLSPSTTCSNLLHDFDSFISLHINQTLWSIPTLAFVVATNILASKGFYSSPGSPLSSQQHRRHPSDASGGLSRRTERFDISQALERHLNKSCKILMIAADGIIASTNDHQSYEIESGKSICCFERMIDEN